jgi:ABC-type dipeptide/oligopeptide/nickel transport system permease subunit
VSDTVDVAVPVALPRRRLPVPRRPLSLRGVLALCGAVALAVEITVAVGAPLVVPASPLAQDLASRLKPPGWVDASGTRHWLGTDTLGRDVLSRVIFGSRVSLVVGCTSVMISAPLGLATGIVSAYYGGAIDAALMRLADIQLAFPLILLVIAIVAVVGPSLLNLILVLGVSGWVIYARVVRSETITLRAKEFTDAARAQGASDARIIFRHILPNTVSSVVVLATATVAYMILLESSLSFLGLGVQPPTPSWGGMVNEGSNYVSLAWWLSVFPGIGIFVTVLAVNFIGDRLRDLLDPRLTV